MGLKMQSPGSTDGILNSEEICEMCCSEGRRCIGKEHCGSFWKSGGFARGIELPACFWRVQQGPCFGPIPLVEAIIEVLSTLSSIGKSSTYSALRAPS